MKLKAFLMIAFCFLLGTTFGQEYKNDLTSVKTIDNQLQDEEYSTDQVAVDRLLLTTPVENITEKDKQFFSRREWKKIKKEIQKNKKKILGEQNGIHTTKVMDTIFLDIPINPRRESQLSGW